MAAPFRFLVVQALTNRRLGYLRMSDVSFNDPLTGAGGSFSGKVTPADFGPGVDVLRQWTEPDQVALYVETDSGYYFGGPIVSRPWSRSDGTLTITALSWKQWFYTRFLNPNWGVDPVADTHFYYDNDDQLFIARDLASRSIIEIGCPTIEIGTETCGVTRDLHLNGSAFHYVGDAIDSMANRPNGFDWDVEIRRVGNSPSLYLGLYFPGRGTVNQSVLLKSTKEGGNITAVPEADDTAQDRRTRVWATGDGQPPDQPVAFDSDPDLDSGLVLLRETVTNWSGVTNITTLSSHAQAQRQAIGLNRNQMVLPVTLDDPALSLYGVGDRVRLLLEDDWLRVDLPTVRIIDRQIKVNSRSAPDSASITVDLSDLVVPSQDQGLDDTGTGG